MGEWIINQILKALLAHYSVPCNSGETDIRKVDAGQAV